MRVFEREGEKERERERERERDEREGGFDLHMTKLVRLIFCLSFCCSLTQFDTICSVLDPNFLPPRNAPCLDPPNKFCWKCCSQGDKVFWGQNWESINEKKNLTVSWIFLISNLIKIHKIPHQRVFFVGLSHPSLE